jgi:endonuclease/exonuclease/phosphatase family metal-dependent hydrolase
MRAVEAARIFPQQSVTTFSLITLNCFGVPMPTTRRRLLALAQELNRREVTVACLQEVQSHTYRRLLVRAADRYPASAYVPFMHAPKGGLLTLARLPIEHVQFTLYRDRGRWYTPAIQDWILHKGALATNMTLDGVPIVVLNTHLTANYSGDWRRSNRYAQHERSQLQQLAQIVNAQPAEALVAVVGDFNIPRGNWLYKEFLAESRLMDPMAGDRKPTFRPPRGIPGRYALPIDFTLLRLPPNLPGLRIRSQLCFEEKYPLVAGRKGYLSDHYGIELELAWNTA